MLPSTIGEESSWCSSNPSAACRSQPCLLCQYKRPTFYCPSCVNAGQYYHSQSSKNFGCSTGKGKQRLAAYPTAAEKRLRILALEQITKDCRDKINRIEEIRGSKAKEAKLREDIKATK